MRLHQTMWSHYFFSDKPFFRLSSHHPQTFAQHKYIEKQQNICDIKIFYIPLQQINHKF